MSSSFKTVMKDLVYGIYRIRSVNFTHVFLFIYSAYNQILDMCARKKMKMVEIPKAVSDTPDSELCDSERQDKLNINEYCDSIYSVLNNEKIWNNISTKN